MLMKLLGSLSLVWLIMATSTWAQSGPAVVDTDGRPLTRGTRYYVLPAATDIAGGLTLVNRNGSCPLYVGQEPLGRVVSQGIPVIFTPRVAADGNIIREFGDFTARFDGASTCVQSTAWRVGDQNPETGRRYIVAGSVSSSSNLGYFNIEKNQQGLYTIRWCPNCLTDICPRPRCGYAGIVVENGKRLLVLDGVVNRPNDATGPAPQEPRRSARPRVLPSKWNDFILSTDTHGRHDKKIH